MLLVVPVAFVVSSCALATTEPATYVSDSGATLNGKVYSTENTGPQYSPDHAVQYWFKYGTTTDYGSVTTPRTLHLPVHAYRDPFPVSEPIRGLSPDTTYHYRACADDAQEGQAPNCTGDRMLTTGSPGGRSGIAYWRFDDGATLGNIWVMEADGSNPTPLTSSSADERNPSWSPDGKQIVYTRGPDTGEQTAYDTWLMDADGGNQHLIHTHDARYDSYPVWSPDGSRIYYFTQPVAGFPELHWMEPDGTGSTALPCAQSCSGHSGHVTVSPDAERFGFASVDNTGSGNPEPLNGIAVFNSDGSDGHLITQGVSELWPAWSPDGQVLAFSRTTQESSTFMEVDADGTNERLFPGTTTIDGAVSFESAWAPNDTNELVFGRDAEIFRISADGSGLTNLTNNQAFEYAPSVSPRP